MPFNISTATVAELIERAAYLENFPAGSVGYRDYLHAEATALRKLAAERRA
jgi:hypothetical protein